MRKQFEASLEHLYSMLRFIRQHAEALNFGERALSKIELAAEEALVNIISHGQVLENSPIVIQCQPLDIQGIKIMIKDQGIPFNPLSRNRCSYNHLPLEDRLKGGHGVDIIRDIMDDVKYSRIDESNELTLIKYLN